jgi:Bacteriophage translational regulator
MTFDLNKLVWVRLPKQDNFLIVKETLTRIGIPSKNEKRLTQSCHILHKKGRYAIVHFKELFLLDGKQADLTEDDIARRNTIANLLEDWGLVELEDQDKTEEPVLSMGQIKIINSAEKKDWELVSKYTIGNKKTVSSEKA